MDFGNWRHYTRILGVAFFLGSHFILFFETPGYAQKSASDFYKRAQRAGDLAQKIDLLTQAITVDPTFTNAYFQLGLAYKEKGDLERALVFLGRTLIANPQALNTELRFQVVYETGLIQRTQGKNAAARESLIAARDLADDPSKRAEIFLLLGQINTDLGKIDEAISNYLDGSRILPQDNRFQTRINQLKSERQWYEWYLEANKQLMLEHYREAIAAYEKILAQNPNFKDTRLKMEAAQTRLTAQKQAASREELDRLYTQGIEYQNRGLWLEASKAFQSILSNDPNHRAAAMHFDEVQTKLQNAPPPASAPVKPEQTIADLYQKALEKFRAQNWVEAIHDFQLILEIEPNYRDTRQKLSQAQTHLNNQGLEPAKQNLYHQAQAAFREKDWLGAINYLQRLLNLDANYLDAPILLKRAQTYLADTSRTDQLGQWYQRGIELMHQENWLEALIIFEKVALADPNYKNVQALLEEAQLRLKSKQSDTGHRAPVRIAATSWKTLLIWTTLGLIGLALSIVVWLKPGWRADFYVRRNQLNQAAAIYEKILNRNHANADACLKLAQIYHQQKREDLQAVRIYENIIRMNLDTPIKSEISTMIAYHYLSQGNLEPEKIDLLEKVLNQEMKKMKSTKG